MSKWPLGLSGVLLGTLMTQGLNASETARFVPGEIIVKFRPGVKAKNFLAKDVIVKLGLTAKREIQLSYQQLNVLKFENLKMQETLAALKTNPDIINKRLSVTG